MLGLWVKFERYIQYLWSKLDNWKTWKTRCTEIVDTGQLFVLENWLLEIINWFIIYPTSGRASMDVHIYLIHSARKARSYPVSLFH